MKRNRKGRQKRGGREKEEEKGKTENRYGAKMNVGKEIERRK